jgi:hypothetical protein
LATSRQVLKQTNSLLPARFSDAQDSLDEQTAPPTIRTAAALPPQDGMTQRPLGRIIRWLDAFLPYEGP